MKVRGGRGSSALYIGCVYKWGEHELPKVLSYCYLGIDFASNGAMPEDSKAVWNGKLSLVEVDKGKHGVEWLMNSLCPWVWISMNGCRILRGERVH